MPPKQRRPVPQGEVDRTGLNFRGQAGSSFTLQRTDERAQVAPSGTRCGAGILTHDGEHRAAVVRLRRLGVDTVIEFLRELGKKHCIRRAIVLQLKEYCRIEPDALRLAGGDRFAPPPMRSFAQ